MKIYLPLLAIAISCYCLSSCTTKSEGGVSPTTQKNLDAMHAISQSFSTRDFSKLGDYIATDAVDHEGDNGDIKGLDSMKVAFAKESATVDSMKTDIIKELADDEYVMSWEHFTGVYKTSYMGHKPGDKFDLKEIEVAKFKDGKATEHWGMMEPADLMRLMSSMAPPTASPMAMPAADSAKKKM